MAPPLLFRMLTPGWAFDSIPASVLPLLGPEVLLAVLMRGEEEVDVRRDLPGWLARTA